MLKRKLAGFDSSANFEVTLIDTTYLFFFVLKFMFPR